MIAIEVKGLKKTYDTNKVEALKGIDVTIQPGDFFGLLGANGAGKSTFIGILSGLSRKSAGKISIFGLDIDTQHDQAKELIGIVPQEFNFSIFEKVWDIVMTQAGYYGLSAKEAAPHAEEILKALGLWEKKDAVSRTLSGGMKRRLMIARALIHKPKLLILDEPTAGVDVELRIGMWEYLQKLSKEGVTIILTTHYLEEAERLCNKVAIINKGTIVKQGTVAELLQGLDARTYVLTVDNATQVDQYRAQVKNAQTMELTLTNGQSLSDAVTFLKEKNIIVNDIRQQENPLERLFLDTIRT